MKSKFKTASTTKPLIAIPIASLVDTSDDPPLEDGVACGDIVVPPDGRRQRGERTTAKKLILERVLWFGAVNFVLGLCIESIAWRLALKDFWWKKLLRFQHYHISLQKKFFN